jgi:hypothetical protein
MIEPIEAADRSQLAAELAHWQGAAQALADLDAVAGQSAWASLESYTRLQLRDRLLAVVRALSTEAEQLHAALLSGAELTGLRRRTLQLRTRYLQVEAVIDFYGDAVNTRTNPRLGALLRGLDTIAGDSLNVILGRLGLPVPPVLVYVGEGLGAAILRAGVRLWDQGNPSPVAAVKLTRHNLSYPTALLHETGHQVAHLTGWTGELAEQLDRVLRPRSADLADAWTGWAGEVAGDVHAFALAGWAPVPALANVVDGTTAAVTRVIPADPHPFPLVRVLFNAALCRDWYGRGPWDRLARTWCDRHLRSDGPAIRLTRDSIEAFGDIVEVCTRTPMRSFGGRSLADLADPMLVSPPALAALARQAGPSLLTSQYLARRESLRILSWLVTESNHPTRDAVAARAELQNWLADFGATPVVRSA